MDKRTDPIGTDLAALVTSLVRAHADTRGPLLPILHDLQATLGYIHPEAIPLLARELNLSRADVYGVVTFYRDFRDRADGRCKVRICAAEACQALGSEKLAESARSSFGIEFGETTTDDAVRLDEVFCLGLCALGPAAEVDGVVYGRMDAQSLHDLVAARR